MNFIETFLGLPFRPLTPNVESVWIDDIAHALSNQCRFSGHTSNFYSVAEHSVRVSRLVGARVARLGFDPRADALWGLLHDASEAYLVDLPTPLKADPEFGVAYRAAESKLMAAICERFGLDIVQPRVVHDADQALLVAEVRDLMPGRPEHWTPYAGVTPLDERIVPWAPRAAESEFLRRFHELGGRHE